LLNSVKDLQATFGNPPDQPITMPSSNCPENSGRNFVCYVNKDAQIYTFGSDCEAEFASTNANTEVSQTQGANTHYEGMKKLHDGSCTELDTETDSLKHEYELTGEAGEDARASVAAREEQEGSYALLSMKQRVRLTSLVHKYVSGDRSVAQNGKIAAVLQRIEDRIGEERTKASKAYKADLAKFEDEKNEEVGNCEQNFKDTESAFSGLRQAAEDKETAATAKHGRKVEKKKAAEGKLNAANALLKEANEQMQKQQPIIEAAYNRRVKDANTAYEEDLKLATDKHTRDMKYIGEEQATINSVVELVAKLGTVQEERTTGATAARTSKVAEELLSMAERVTSKRVFRIAQAARLSARRNRYNVEEDLQNEQNTNTEQSTQEATRLSESTGDYTDTLAKKGIEDDDTTKNLSEESVDSLDDFEAQERYNDQTSGNRDGNTAYTDYKMRNSGAMDQVRSILRDLDQQLDVELSEVSARKINNDKLNADHNKKLQERASDIFAEKVAALAGIVDVAQKNRDDASAKKDVANAALEAASSKYDVVAATHTAVKQTSEKDIERYGDDQVKCKDNADTVYDKDKARIDLQKKEALEYLKQEQDVVNQIRELLKDLNLEFTPTEMGGESYATSFVQLRSGKKQMLTGKQKAAIRTLVSLAGKLEPREYIDSSKHSAKETIANLLDDVEETLRREVESVNEQHGEDMNTIATERTDQKTRCDSIYTHQVDESERRVKEAKANMDHANSAVVAATAASGDANMDFSAKEVELSARKDQEREGTKIAKAARDEDQKQAQDEFDRRATEISQEAKADTTYLEASKAAIGDIFEFIGEASAFVQVATHSQRAKASAGAATGEMGSYITHSSGSSKDRINALLTRIENHINDELNRVADEHDADTKRLQKERDEADEETTFFRDDDLKKLADVRAHAEDEKAESDKVLAAATADHMEKSRTHNHNMDTLETAKQIQITNLPIFTRDRDQTLQQATYVFQQEEEIIDAKRHQADYYLQTEAETLEEIEAMLSRVNMLQAAPNNFDKTTNGFDEAYGEAHAAGVWNLAHNAKTWNKINTHETERARETGFTYDDHTRSDVDDHVLTNFRGEKVKFDTAGELVSEPNTDFVSKADLDTSAKTTASKVTDEMINGEAQEALSGRTTAARAALIQIAARHGVKEAGATTVGSYLNEVQNEVHNEQGRVEKDHVAETNRVAEMRNMLHKKARDTFKAETDEDKERVRVAQAEHDASKEALEIAHAAKVEATKINIQKAAILRDAIKTQKDMTPKIIGMFNSRMADNKERHDTAQASIDASRKDAEEYLNKEKSVIEEVRPIIDGMDSSGVPQALIQVVHKVVRRTLQRIASKRYDFDVRKSKDYVDRQEEQYMNNGDQGKEGDKYKKVFTSEGGINEVIDNLRKELQQEIQNVAKGHSEELAKLTEERESTVEKALKKKREEKARLTAALNKAVEEHHVSSHDLAQQQDAYDQTAMFQGAKVQEEEDKIAAQAQNKEEQTATLGNAKSAATLAYSTETAEFNRIKAASIALIASERASMTQIRDFANNRLASGPAEEKAVDRCENQKEAYDSAKATAAQESQACALDTVRATGQEEDLRSDTEACDRNAEAQSDLIAAKSAYEACIAKKTGSAFISTKVMRTKLRQLSKKYIDREAEAEKAGDIQALNSLLDQIDAKINADEAKANETYTKDMKDSLDKRDAELTRAQKRYDDEIAHHAAVVASATARRQEADRQLAAEKATLDEKTDIDNNKAAAQDAAQDDVNTQFPILESQAQATIQQANQHFLNEKTRIDAIKASDTEYLNDEISTVDEVQRILSQLNARGGGTAF